MSTPSGSRPRPSRAELPPAIDRLPPHSVEAEQSVLGSIIIDSDAIFIAAEHVKPDDFYRPAHKLIYEAMLSLSAKRQPIDIVTLPDAIGADLESIGGSAYLASLINLTPTAVNVEYYAKMVSAKAVNRRLVTIAGKIAAVGYADDEPAQSIDRAEQLLHDVAERSVRSGFKPLRSLLHEAYDRLDFLTQNQGQHTGLSTGLFDFDFLTNGLQASDLVIVAARPSVGKTSLALNIARVISSTRKVVGIFSLEMSEQQLIVRLLAEASGIDSHKLRNGYLNGDDFHKLGEAMNTLSNAELWIDDTPNISPVELRTKARRLQMQVGLDLVIVDYLQLMHTQVRSRDANRVQEVSELTRELKALARELNLPVLCLSQLSRGVESRESKKPRLSDLRDSGSIEQDADVVIFLWREGETPSGDEIINVDVAKQRNGPVGSFKLLFQKRLTRFQSIKKEGQ